MKYWYILLKEWRQKGNIGLTVPFLIGSQSYLKNNTKHSIANLIGEVTQSQLPVYLSYCGHINDLILGLIDEKYGNFSGSFLSTSGLPSKFYISSFIGKDLSMESVISLLEEKHSFDIESGSFSRNNKILEPFTENDIDFIKNTFTANGV